MRRKGKSRPLLVILGTLFVACSVTAFVVSLAAQQRENAKYESLRLGVNQVTPEPAADSEDTQPEAEAEEFPQELSAELKQKMAELGINFTSLKEVNSDICAWITVEGTKVSYPVLRSETDDELYLDHDFKKNETKAGSIYMESLNSPEFTDVNTILYGHNQKDLSMFGSLHQFEDPDFFREHKEITVYLPNEVLVYEIFAAYQADARHLLYSYNFTQSDEFEDYLSTLNSREQEKFQWREGMEVTTEDNIITLSTCARGGRSDRRYLVLGVLKERKH